MEAVLKPLAETLGVSPVTLALLAGLAIGAVLVLAVRGREPGRGNAPHLPRGGSGLPFHTRMPPGADAGPLDAQGLQEVEALLDQGKGIEAIRRVRELTHVGLKEAKDLVDALRRHRS